MGMRDTTIHINTNFIDAVNKFQVKMLKQLVLHNVLHILENKIEHMHHSVFFNALQYFYMT